VSDRSGSRRLAAWLVLGCAAIVVFATTKDATRSGPGTSPSAAEPSLPAPSSDAPSLSGAPPTTPSSSPTPTREPLAHFHEALSALAAGARSDHVRILFFGDSHAQGELWTGGLRRRLQARFGDGGPGFFAAGSPRHRNDALTSKSHGAFVVSPRDPATTSRSGDGKLGLGGLVARSERGTSGLEIAPRTPGDSSMRWDVCSLAGAKEDAVRVGGTGLEPNVVHGAPGELVHTVVKTQPPHRLTIDVGGAALCGVVGEREGRPGVVLDALGINGARFATMLAWDEATFRAELARRKPDLVVLEYGTNEASDRPPRPADLARDLADVVARVRGGAPLASCLVLSLTERNDRVDETPILRDAEAEAAARAGCAFWDTYDEMGGRGSLAAWQGETPTLAQRDGIHLTADGYDKLAELLYADLVRECADPR
jgi:lysophospholipase L1-like esterase